MEIDFEGFELISRLPPGDLRPVSAAMIDWITT
jgi:hypothetical protein